MISTKQCDLNAFEKANVCFCNRHYSTSVSSCLGSILMDVSSRNFWLFKVASLPRLPVPELTKTCERYVEALRPIISDENQLNATKQLVKEFESSDGKTLHSQLIEENKRNAKTSYISQPWFEYYLKSRTPLPINYNPFLAWKDDPNPEYNTQLLRTSNMILSAMRFRRSYVEQLLAPEVFHLNPIKSDTKLYRNVMKWTPDLIATYASFAFKAFPLDMSQFESLFSSTRIPKQNFDELIRYPNSRHISVLKNGQFFVFDVMDSNGDLKEPSVIMTCIQHIMDSPINPNEDSITLLTTENRDVWAKAREQLIGSSAQNKESLHLVDSSLFVVCLDDISVGEKTADNLIRVAHNFLHGFSDKTKNYVNRWYDKSFTILMSRDGRPAINFEHSWGDGVAVLRFFNEIYQDSTQNHFVHPNSPLNKAIDVSKEVKKLSFELNEGLRSAVKAAKSNYAKNTENLELNFTKYDKMNREYMKRKKVSPDSIFQLGFQMAFYQLYNTFVATYESCSTSAFKHGRTETVRSATMATKNASIAFLKHQKPSDSELRQLLDECSKRHFQLTKEAAMGQGFDRHLFVMKYLAEKTGKSIPELYLDKSYTEANNFILSTSTLFGECFEAGGFGPVVPNGFGCGYGYTENILGIIVSSYAPHRNGKQFVDAFSNSLDRTGCCPVNCSNTLDARVSLSPDGDLKDPSVMTCIQHIMDSPINPNEDSITLLTTENRDIWAKARDQLIGSSAQNKESLHLVDSSLFVVCLDDISVGEKTADNLIRIAHNFLHGFSDKTKNYVNRQKVQKENML
ncbi:unnamed protein product [Oppiella nova]|uniref:Choline/carnitine acyltransferase domain-containing protein n=1 Tax=Oppiella nova TaxID=334625 RepID=A0A7R9LX66_9ACAR|nr:unnamed protein product [Oppiella nova]CAG2167758.1 unnamed protein product [Oppiella nova]